MWISIRIETSTFQCANSLTTVPKRKQNADSDRLIIALSVHLAYYWCNTCYSSCTAVHVVVTIERDVCTPRNLLRGEKGILEDCSLTFTCLALACRSTTRACVVSVYVIIHTCTETLSYSLRAQGPTFKCPLASKRTPKAIFNTMGDTVFKLLSGR
jgi:hypothetical protein